MAEVINFHDRSRLSFVDWCETRLTVPIEPRAGEPWKVLDFQAEFYDAVADPQHSEVALSTPRKLGKSGMVAADMVGTFVADDSPIYKPNVVGIYAAMQKTLAEDARDFVVALCEASNIEIKRRGMTLEAPCGNRIFFLTGSKVQGQARPGTWRAYLDEVGFAGHKEWAGIYANFRSAIIGTGGKLICTGVQSTGPLFADIRKRAESGDFPNVWCRVQEADPKKPLDDVDELKRIYRGAWGHTIDPRLALISAREAAMNPNAEVAFRLYGRNEKVNENVAAVIPVEDVDKCTTENAVQSEMRRGLCFLGWDAGGASSMTALVAFWPETGWLEIRGCYPSEPALNVRSRNDGVGALYTVAHRTGELKVFGKNVTDIAAFLRWAKDEWLAGAEVDCIAGDRYRQAELEDFLEESDWEIDTDFQGQGAGAAADGSRNILLSQRLFKSGKMKIFPSLLLNQALAEAEIAFSAGGLPRLKKADTVNKSRARIDVLSALVMAIGSAAKYG